MEKCQTCLNSRAIISENGIQRRCCLSSKKAVECLIGEVDRYDSIRHLCAERMEVIDIPRSPKVIEDIITGYESPIKKYVDEVTKGIQQKEDAYLMECVRKVGIDVDKEELLKALRYDRDQYEKGFEAGRCRADIELAREIFEEIEKELTLALASNYRARNERLAHPNVEMADEFVSYCDGKIHTLRGLNDFLNELKKKYTEEK